MPDAVGRVGGIGYRRRQNSHQIVVAIVNWVAHVPLWASRIGLALWVADEYIVVHCSMAQGSKSDMNKTAPVSVRLDAALNERVTAVARTLDRPKSWVIEQAVQDFVAMQEWQLAAIDEGLRAADAARVVPHEDVVAWVQSWGRPDELPMPKCE